MNLMFFAWSVLLIIYIISFKDGFGTDPLAIILTFSYGVGLPLNALLFYIFKTQCKAEKHFLVIENKQIVYHGRNVFGKETASVVTIFDNFHTFFVEKTFLFGNAIFINEILTGKKKMIISGEVYDQDSEMILILINKASSSKE